MTKKKDKTIENIEKEMKKAAKDLDFESNRIKRYVI